MQMCVFGCCSNDIAVSKKKIKMPQEPVPGQQRANLQVKAGGFSVGAFATSNRGKLEELYDVEEKVLGEGSYGSVQRCHPKEMQQARALKTIKKSLLKTEEQVREEMEIMKLLDHPNIVRLYETFEDIRNIYLVLELCVGGELFDRILAGGKFTEHESAHSVQQMLRALNYLHQNWIMHRDLKPENWLLASDAAVGKTELKLIDFGLAKRFSPGVFASTKAGTPYYVAPEVLEGRYAEKSDVWSIGVIMYVLLGGCLPFQGNDTMATLDAVKQAKPSFTNKEWKDISSEAKSLQKALLTRDPDSRPSAAEALQSEWIRKALRNTEVAYPCAQAVPASLRTFAMMNKLKKASLNVIATQLSDDDLSDLKKLFVSMDDNNDGTLSVGELRQGLSKAGVSLPPDLRRIMEQIDTDGSGVIDYSEFMAATIHRRKYIAEDVCWLAFKTFDVDGNGSIDREELARLVRHRDIGDVLQVEVTEQEIDAILMEVDLNGDGTIDFDEFLEMMRRIPQSAAARRNKRLRSLDKDASWVVNSAQLERQRPSLRNADVRRCTK